MTFGPRTNLSPRFVNRMLRRNVHAFFSIKTLLCGAACRANCSAISSPSLTAPLAAHVFQRQSLVRGCKADALTIGANRQNFGDPNERPHPPVNRTLHVACMQNACGKFWGSIRIWVPTLHLVERVLGLPLDG